MDIGDGELMRSRSWRWLSLRIIGLLTTECRIQRQLNPAPKPPAPKRRGEE